MNHLPKQPSLNIHESVLAWLLDSDPAIRWQVMRDLVSAPGDQVAAERARMAGEGLGMRLLDPRCDLSRHHAGSVGGGCGPAQPLDHAARLAGVEMVASSTTQGPLRMRSYNPLTHLNK